MNPIQRTLTVTGRAALMALLSGLFPAAACKNSDSIGALTDGGKADGTAGAGTGGAAGAGSGGRVGTGGVTGAGGLTSSGTGTGGGAGAAAGGSAGTATGSGAALGSGGAGAGGTKSGTGGAGTGGAGTGGANGGAGGSKADAATPPDVLLTIDGSPLGDLCVSTGGQIATGLCCTSAADFPDSCLVGACGCSPTSSHTVAVCSCPTGSCFSPKTGCGSRTGTGGAGGGGGGTGGAGGAGGAGGMLDAGQDGNVACGSATCGAGEYCCNPASNLCAPLGYGCIQSGSDAPAESNGCTALPEADATFCGGSYPPHYYGCIGTMLAAPCKTISIGDMTNTFCCP